MVAKKGELYNASAKKKDVRTSNIEAAKAVADAVRTSLGPRGMDKMVGAVAAAAAAATAAGGGGAQGARTSGSIQGGRACRSARHAGRWLVRLMAWPWACMGACVSGSGGGLCLALA